MSKTRSRGIRLLIRVIKLFIFWLLIHIIVTVVSGLSDTDQAADVAVVLGSKVEENGQMSHRLRARVDRGLELYQNQQVKRILVSGGFGKEGFEEAEVMRQHLLDNGVPDTHILVDKNGYNTYQTAQSTKRLLAQEGMKSVIVVSQYFHIIRSCMTMRKFNIEVIGSAYAKIGMEGRDIRAIVREFFGYYYYLLRRYPA